MKTPILPSRLPASSRWRVLALLCVGTLAAHSPTVAAVTDGGKAMVVVNVDLTPEGEKIRRPSASQPAYYVPVILGYHEGGKIIAGEKPPSRQEMVRQMGRALAKEGYVLQALRPDANTTTPSLILVFEWGYLNPAVLEHGALDLTTDSYGGTMSPSALRSDPTQQTKTELNQSEMITLVAGSALKRQAYFTQSDWEKLRDAVSEDRYFIIVSAYDFAASLKDEQRLLWRARMSTGRQGVWMDDVLSALVAAGAPKFGRASGPEFSTVPITRGTVRLGPLEIKDAAVSPAELKPTTEKKP